MTRTLADRVAEALPCRVWDEEKLRWSKSPWGPCGDGRGHVIACSAQYRPAVLALLVELREECAGAVDHEARLMERIRRIGEP